MSAAQETGALPWRVAGTLAITQVIHWGSLFYAFSVLMPAMVAETGWPVELVVGAFSAGLLAEAGAAVLTGLMLDRLGAARVMAVGSLAAGIGLWLAGQVQAPWQLYAVWIGLGATMAATLYQAAFAAITAAFGAGGARRGIAFVAFAGGLASTIFWPLTSLLVGWLGWREACGALALLNLACALPHRLLLPGAAPAKPSAAAQTVAGREFGLPWRQPRFWALLFVYAALGLSSSTIAVHLVPLLHERGLGDSAAAIASLVGIAQVAGRVAEFAGGGRLPVGTVGLIATGALPPVFLALALLSDPLPLALAVGLYGAANGVMTVVRGALPALMFGTARYGAISGILSAAGAFSRAAGPIGMAWLWQRLGGYAEGMVAIALLSALSMIALAAATGGRRAPQE
ncbi:MFS transporter [Roseomonas sp. SSH11]|uniref:MFS transporter n=1 Tax=Pararoseomonas baculiformis TaxID=2820812 RepID=A0ABS4AEQ0_9PROT|nr:MFS transporter [Pararoseomonas baculiformis]